MDNKPIKPVFEGFVIAVRTIGAVRLTFLASILLSLIVVAGNHALNRDGMLYIDTAREILEHRVGASGFDWLFFPFIIAVFGGISHLNLEMAAQTIDALFLAGACALLVDMTRRRMPEAAWAACLIVLAMPAYNGYRDYVIREFGYWFFCMLSFWCALRWEDHGYRWRDAVACQSALAIAILFRLEAVMFFPALAIWQVFSAPRGEKLRRMLMVCWLPLLAAGMLVVLTVTGGIHLPDRVFNYLRAAEFWESKQGFSHAAARLRAVLPVFSAEDTGLILGSGLVALISLKFLQMLGIFIVPFGYACLMPEARTVFRQWSMMGWAFMFSLLALVFFAWQNLFVSARYVSILNLLAVPMVAVGYAVLTARHPGWRRILLPLAIITMMTNVVSFKSNAAYLKDAGRWLAVNAENPDRVYAQDTRVIYYAGWKYAHDLPPFDPTSVEQKLARDEIDFLVLEESHGQLTVTTWLQTHALIIRAIFMNRSGDKIIIAQSRFATDRRMR